MNAMKFNGLELPEDVSERLWDIPGSHGICNNLCYGYMTYNKTDGVYLIPATETVEGVRAKIKELSLIHISSVFIPDKESKSI